MKTMDIYKEAKTQYVQGRWGDWPENSNQDLAFEWLMKFQKTVLTELSHIYYISAHKVLRESEADRMPNISSLLPVPYRTASRIGQMYSSLENTNRILMRIVL